MLFTLKKGAEDKPSVAPSGASPSFASAEASSALEPSREERFLLVFLLASDRFMETLDCERESACFASSSGL